MFTSTSLCEYSNFSFFCDNFVEMKLRESDTVHLPYRYVEVEKIFFCYGQIRTAESSHQTLL
jgi:hypothetical protein